jgi:outer membrane receptor protein involved in Fe transport
MLAVALAFGAFSIAASDFEGVSPPLQQLRDMTFEDLMDIKKSEKRQAAAAAIFVITQDDIRRSGATTIPDLLRMVPGVSVARLDSNTWAVSARGFSGKYSNKLLVLVVGRSVYTPLHSGVYWENLDVLFEDVELDVVLRYADQLPALGVEDYLTMDARLGWRPSKRFELSIVGRNLLDSGHAEFSPTYVKIIPTQVQRGVYGELSWWF